jgi:hypothetical protein
MSTEESHTHTPFAVVGSIPLPSAGIGRPLPATQREDRLREIALECENLYLYLISP